MKLLAEKVYYFVVSIINLMFNVLYFVIKACNFKSTRSLNLHCSKHQVISFFKEIKEIFFYFWRFKLKVVGTDFQRCHATWWLMAAVLHTLLLSWVSYEKMWIFSDLLCSFQILQDLEMPHLCFQTCIIGIPSAYFCVYCRCEYDILPGMCDCRSWLKPF